MKVKVTKKELRECVANAVVRALNENRGIIKEDEWDDLLAQALGSDPKAAKAQKAAQSEIDQEVKASEADDAAANDFDVADDEEDVEDDAPKFRRGDDPTKGGYDLSEFTPADWEDAEEVRSCYQRLRERMASMLEQGFTMGSSAYKKCGSFSMQLKRALKSIDPNDEVGKVAPQWGAGHEEFFQSMRDAKLRNGKVGNDTALSGNYQAANGGRNLV